MGRSVGCLVMRVVVDKLCGIPPQGWTPFKIPGLLYGWGFRADNRGYGRSMTLFAPFDLALRSIILNLSVLLL
jgi:hypothetical protein